MDQLRLPRILNYHGSKYSLAPWILSFAPPHQCFVDVFGGSASLFCTKQPVPFEIYNDAGDSVTVFFRVLREHPKDLARAVALTPWSRAELAMAWEPSSDPLEHARRFVVRSWQARSAASWKAGWRFQRSDTRGGIFTDQWGTLPEALLLFAERMKRVQIEHDDATAVVRRFDHPLTLFFADPPYLPEVRSTTKSYEQEMSVADHIALATDLCAAKGFVLLCGYPSRLYRDLYETNGWRRVERPAIKASGARATEALWISPRTQESLGNQLGPLFQRVTP